MKNRHLFLILFSLCIITVSTATAQEISHIQHYKGISTMNHIYISALYVGDSYDKSNKEYIQITNNGTSTKNLHGWTIAEKNK